MVCTVRSTLQWRPPADSRRDLCLIIGATSARNVPWQCIAALAEALPAAAVDYRQEHLWSERLKCSPCSYLTQQVTPTCHCGVTWISLIDNLHSLTVRSVHITTRIKQWIWTDWIFCLNSPTYKCRMQNILDFELAIAPPSPQGEFSALLFSDSPMSPEHFLLVLQSGHRGIW